jgi:hypothetical protein
MPITKSKCKNDERCTYTGKECSPLGLGYAPHPFDVGTFHDGKDNTTWMVATKNDVKVWVRVPTELKHDVPVIPPSGPPTEDDDTEPAPAPKPLKKKAAPKKKASVKGSDDEEPAPVPKPAKKKAAPKKQASVKGSDDEGDEEPAPAKKKAAPKKASVKGSDDEDDEAQEPAPAKKKAAPKKKASVKGSDDEDDEAVAKPVKKLPTDYNLFLKVQMEIVKNDPDRKDMPAKERLGIASKQASTLWKTMSAKEKADAVAHLK